MPRLSRFGSQGFPDFGNAKRIMELPERVPITFDDFSGGYDVSRSRETIERNATPNALDFEVTERNRLVRLPGTTLLESMAPHVPTQVFLQASLDNRSELILLAPPFLGVKSVGATTWYDLGLTAGRRFSAVNFGGTLILSDRSGEIYVRQADSDTVEQTDVIPQGYTYASFASRVFVGGAVIDGRLEPMGMRWSAANSNYLDWETLGSGFELLINDMSAGDRIVSLNTMGLDFMAVFMRRSIWIGRRTGIAQRPADFQPRVPAIGAVNAATCKSTPGGVIFLSDTGVYLFDGNTAQPISLKINAELLPLVDDGQNYSSMYHPGTQRYYLFTPTDTWIYDMLRQRWYRSSMVATGGVMFAEQFDATRWADLVGTWGDLSETWAEFSPQEADAIRMLFLGQQGADTVLTEEDVASTAYFGVAQTPRWEFPRTDDVLHNQLVTTEQVNLRYVGEGEVELYMPDNNGDMVLRSTRVLLPAATPRTEVARLAHTGMGAGLEIRNIDGRVEFISAQLVAKRRGPRIEAVAP